MSWKQWEALLFLQKSKRNFLPWWGLFTGCSAETPCGEGSREARESANTARHARGGSLTSPSVLQLSPMATSLGLLIKHCTPGRNQLTLQPGPTFTQNSLGGRRGEEGNAKPSCRCAEQRFRGNPCPTLFTVFLFVPNSDHQEGPLR